MQPRPSDFQFWDVGAVDQLRRILLYAFAKNGRRVDFPTTPVGRTPLTDSGAAHEGHMKGMASTPDYYIPPDKGPHAAIVIATECCLSKKNNTQIKISVQLQATGEVLEDYLGTDGTVKGAGISKTKLRGLGIDISSDAEVPDEVIAQQLLNRQTIVELDHESAQKKSESDPNQYVNATHFDPATGQTIQLKRAKIIGFRTANVGGAPVQGAPSQQAYAQAPQQFAQPAAQPPFAQAPVQYAPPQAPPQQQWAPPPAAPQYAPPVQQQVQPQYAPPAPQYAPQPQPQQQPQYAPPAQQMPQAWAPPQGAPQVQYQQPPQQPVYAQAPQVPQMAPVQMQPPAPPTGVPWATAPQGAPVESPAQQEEKKRRGRPPKAAAEAPQNGTQPLPFQPPAGGPPQQ